MRDLDKVPALTDSIESGSLADALVPIVHMNLTRLLNILFCS